MISLDVDGCKVDILPVVNGLVSEADRVRESFGDYEAYGMTLGIEGIQCLKNRASIDSEFDVSELDLVYMEHLKKFGEVDIPSPAMYTFVDLVKERGMNVIALDMNDEDFTELYCKTVKTTDFLREHRLAKKGMKTKFRLESPESFAKEWDSYVNKVKGYDALSRMREEHAAAQIRDVARFRKSLMVVAEVERIDGIVALLR